MATGSDRLLLEPSGIPSAETDAPVPGQGMRGYRLTGFLGVSPGQEGTDGVKKEPPPGVRE